MIVAPNGWCDHAHINEGIKSRHHAGPKKYKQDDKKANNGGIMTQKNKKGIIVFSANILIK
ncbi:hypothetical protein HTZ85_22480 [Escherichia coli]|nr:hypothetical protein [Escherichia coli]